LIITVPLPFTDMPVLWRSTAILAYARLLLLRSEVVRAYNLLNLLSTNQSSTTKLRLLNSQCSKSPSTTFSPPRTKLGTSTDVLLGRPSMAVTAYSWNPRSAHKEQNQWDPFALQRYVSGEHFSFYSGMSREELLLVPLEKISPFNFSSDICSRDESREQQLQFPHRRSNC
jgi:hypothetical protein